uniref:Uncharacterized protein n=1 Tax=Arundo donax TaxID=35708 RepID=A0A0A9DCF6_ARUDO
MRLHSAALPKAANGGDSSWRRARLALLPRGSWPPLCRGPPSVDPGPRMRALSKTVTGSPPARHSVGAPTGGRLLHGGMTATTRDGAWMSGGHLGLPYCAF